MTEHVYAETEMLQNRCLVAQVCYRTKRLVRVVKPVNAILRVMSSMIVEMTFVYQRQKALQSQKMNALEKPY